MKFNGQWVPDEVMDTILGLWLVAALMVLVAFIWSCRAKLTKSDVPKAVKSRRSKKRKAHKRH